MNPAGRELLADWNLDLGDAAPPEIVEVAQATLSVATSAMSKCLLAKRDT